MSGTPIPRRSEAAVKKTAEQTKKPLSFPAEIFKKIPAYFKEVLAQKETSLNDYIAIGRFYFAKKLLLAAALFIIAAIPVIIKLLPEDKAKLPVLYQGSGKLASFTGKAKLLSKNGSLVYEGDLEAGVYQGSGKRFVNGRLRYRGSFAAGSYTGLGLEYYSNGAVKYRGEFQNNQYSGTGSRFNANGVLIYTGAFKNGLYHGAGKLYDGPGNLIYEGLFTPLS